MPRIPKPEGPPGAVWFGGEIEQATVTFRVFGESLEPDEITRLMGQGPTHSTRKGQAILLRNGKERIARNGSWMIERAMTADQSLDDTITSVLEQLPDDASIWEPLSHRFKLDLICDVIVRGAKQGFVIPPKVLEMISQRRLNLGVDIFPENDPEQAEGLGKAVEGSS